MSVDPAPISYQEALAINDRLELAFEITCTVKEKFVPQETEAEDVEAIINAFNIAVRHLQKDNPAWSNARKRLIELLQECQ